MKYTIENQFLKVEVIEKGAELNSIFQKKHQVEYLWSGDASFWAKKSPVLFPIVGTLKDNTYIFGGKSYSLGRHGFARDKLFTVTKQQPELLEFTLTDDKETLLAYPFNFQFQVVYQLRYDDMDVKYIVNNTGEQTMYFSVGAHPAFRVPLVNGTKYQDYYLQFETAEDAGRYPISRDGLIEAEPVPVFGNSNKLPLTKELFQEDALVFKQLRSQKVELGSGNTGRGVELSFPGFPYLGIWAAKNADFVCIEPWCGIADSVTADQQLENKEGINKLAPGESFSRTWSARFF
jgi:galactose mutarotase-like enzyme